MNDLRLRRRPTARVRFERLESRELLTGTDLLVTSLEDTFGDSVLRYGAKSYVAAPGSVATGDNSLAAAQGLAVAGDGSFYVSNASNGTISHYNNNGTFITSFGGFIVPGTLVVHPTTGNLWAGDLGAGVIYELNPTTGTVLSIFSDGFTPGGFTFAKDASHDLIVGSISTQAVYRYSGMTQTTLLNPGSGVFPASILSDNAGNLYIADLNFDFNPLTHHQVLRRDVVTGLTTQFINLGPSPSDPSGPALQPSALLFDLDGNLLVGASPDHAGNGVVQKYNISTAALISTIASGIGTPTGLALAPAVPTDLINSGLEATDGLSVVRYNNPTNIRVNGGAAEGDHGLGNAQGLVVAPDGSYYVSSRDTANVQHYSNTGVYIDSLGDGTLFVPGTLAFHPTTHHLYVGDLAQGKIFEYDTSAPAAPVATFTPGYTPGGIAFTRDYTHQLIVGALDFQAVYQYSYPLNPMTPQTIVAPGSGIFAASILPDINGNLYIADLNFDFVPTAHHQIVRYDATTHLTTQWVNLGPSPSDPSGPPLQPSGLLWDHDGNILVGASPDHANNGVIQKFNVNTAASMGYLVTEVGSPTALGFIPSFESVVAKRQVFYNNSKFDGNGNNGGGISASDDLAIATDKSAYFAGGGLSTFANMTSFNKGLNGVMIDLSGPHAAMLTASDFIFRVGTNNAADTWSSAPAPVAISIRPGAGTLGTDRVEIVWADGAIKNQWLQVIVKSNANTGLPDLDDGYPAGQGDVFFFANKIGNVPGLAGGDTANFANVGANDQLEARTHLGIGANVGNLYDFDRNKIVDANDELIARGNLGSLRFISVAAPVVILAIAGGDDGPDAQPAVAGDSGVASALAAAAPVAAPLARTADSAAAPIAPVRQLVLAAAASAAAQVQKAQLKAGAADQVNLDELLSDLFTEEIGL